VSLRFKAHLGLLLCSFFWGVTFVIVKDALADSSVFAYLAARFTLGALPMAWYYREDLRKLTAADFWAGVRIGILMFGGYAFQTAGMAETTPSKAAFITGFSVVLVPVLMALLWRRRISAWAWAGASASLAGLYYLTVPREGFAELNRGDLLVTGCTVCYALQIIFIERYSGEHSLAGLSFLQVAVTAVLSLGAVPLLALAHLEPFRFHLTPELVFAVIVTAVFTTAIAYPLLVWGQSHTSAANTALILASEPVFAAVTSYIVLHERLGARGLVGAALILAGILIAELKGSPRLAEESRGAVRKSTQPH
jgi:drug/metabolite transporter (DMT)-like permease